MYLVTRPISRNLSIYYCNISSAFISLQEVLHLIEVAKLEPDIVTFGLLALGCKVMEDAKEYLQDLHFEGIK